MDAFFLLSHISTKPGCLQAASDVVQNRNLLTRGNRSNPLGVDLDVPDKLQLR